jgi:hypothetical protein
MMWSMVGLKRAFMASGFILNMPWEDHFTKSTLRRRRRTGLSGGGGRGDGEEEDKNGREKKSE